MAAGGPALLGGAAVGRDLECREKHQQRTLGGQRLRKQGNMIFLEDVFGVCMLGMEPQHTKHRLFY